jgi:MoxR-like ATPase
VGAVSAVRLVDEIVGYVVALVRATRESIDLETGASPRAGAMLALGARARAALEGRDYVIPDDVKALAAPALRHRVILSPAAEIEGRGVEEIIRGLIEAVEAPR